VYGARHDPSSIACKYRHHGHIDAVQTDGKTRAHPYDTGKVPTKIRRSEEGVHEARPHGELEGGQEASKRSGITSPFGRDALLLATEHRGINIIDTPGPPSIPPSIESSLHFGPAYPSVTGRRDGVRLASAGVEPQSETVGAPGADKIRLWPRISASSTRWTAQISGQFLPFDVDMIVDAAGAHWRWSSAQLPIGRLGGGDPSPAIIAPRSS